MTSLPVRRFLALLTAGVASATSVALPSPEALAQESVALTPSDDGWYRPNPGCGTPVGCLDTRIPGVPTPNTSPYPEGTLHIGVVQGLETARSYLAFSIPDTRIPTSGTLTIPVDGPDSGSVVPESSQVAVCPFYGSITNEPGAMTPPPTPACEASAMATYDADAGQLVVDLQPLLTSIAFGAGLALLPNAAANQPTDNWHVAFSSADRDEESAAPPTEPPPGPPELVLTYAAATTPETPPAPGPSAAPTPPPSSSPSLRSPIAPVAPVARPAPTPEPAPEVASPPDAAQPPVAAPGVPIERIVVTGYAYPAAVRLPFLLLLLGILVGRSLTGELAPRRRTSESP